MGDYKYLFSPIKIGSMTVPNRIMMAPHAMIGMQVGTDAHIGYFEERAKGGAGMLVIASCLLHPHPADSIGMLYEIYDKRDIESIRKTVDAIHKHGSKAIVQGIWLPSWKGMKTPSKVIPTTLEAIGQSRELTTKDIHELIEWHALGSLHAKETGADGVEFAVGGGDGLQYFLSTLQNKRTDEYGGSVENRVRILIDIAKAIKERCGDDFNIGYCINADDSLLGGAPLEVGVQACRLVAESGYVDWLRIMGRAQKPQHFQLFYPSSFLPQGTHLYAAAAVRDAIGDMIPIISGGRINSPEFAEQAIAEGQCDMVFAARAFLCDPEWPKKAREGRESDIRGCIGDTEGCFLRIATGGAAGCTCNPRIGSEHLPIEKAAKPKKVLVVGGGLAGMQTALTAAERGHDVTLVEKTGRLGGHVMMEAQIPGLGDRAELVRWLSDQMKANGVDVRLDCDADTAFVEGFGADAVVVATGAEFSKTGITWRNMMGIEGIDPAMVMSPEDVLIDGKDTGQRVCIVDGTGYVIAPGLAEILADKGKDVVFVCDEPVMAKALMPIGHHQQYTMHVAPKVDFRPNTMITRADGHALHAMDVLTYEETEIADVDTVIPVASKPPCDELYNELEGKVSELYIVGDADDAQWGAFGMDDAVKAGYALGMKL